MERRIMSREKMSGIRAASHSSAVSVRPETHGLQSVDYSAIAAKGQN